MRITVNLSIFFHDHRSLAKIFINKNMKCIKDVEDHITKIFKIHNFYLKCDNQYLPPTEDVQILNYDDIVWAVPRKNETTHSTDNGFLVENEPESEHVPIIEKKKKKKKKIALDNNEIITQEKKRKKKVNHISENIINCEDVDNQDTNDFMEVDNSSTPKKQKKRKHIYTKDETSKNFECENSSGCESGAKKQKQKLNSSENVYVQECTPKDSGRDSFEGSKSVPVTPENTNINVKSLVHSFENGKTNFAKCFRQAVTDGSERRVNIVKTIIVSKPTSTTESTSNSPNIEDSNSSTKQKEQNPDISSDTKNEIDDTPRVENSSKLETSGSILNDTFTVPDANVNKRRRRRTHRKKRDSSCRGEISTTFEQPVYNFIHKPLIVQTPTHIRFSEEHSLKDKEVIAVVQSTPKHNEVAPIPSTPKHEVAVMMQSTPKHNDVAAIVQPTTNHEVAAVVESTKNHNEVVLVVNSTPEHNEVAKHQQSSTKRNGVPKFNGFEVDNEQRSSLATEVIVISESPGSVIQTSKHEESMKEAVENAKSTYSDKEIEECILKQPITAKAEPRIGDVIAFKILRISENYTPEVSAPVVGKVVNYTPEDKEITFNIVYGREQCQMPQGKFALEQEECPAEEDHSQFQCCWSSLLEPRLLFP